jgi:hypothetical protein
MAFASPLPYNIAVFVSRAIAQGRLSLSPTDPAPVADQLAATEAYYIPFTGGQVGLYDPALNGWDVKNFIKATLSLVAYAANAIISVFGFWGGGGLQLEAVAWRNFGQAVTGGTKAAPCVITAVGHGLKSGDTAYVSGVGGLPSATGTWTVNKLGANTFELLGSDTTGDSGYTADGWFTAIPSFLGKPITGASAANPIVITSAAHGLSTGASVTIAHVKGNTPANGTWTVTVIDADTFSIPVANGGAYTAFTGYWVDNSLSPADGIQDGIQVKPGDKTRRLLGLIIMDGMGGESEDSAANRLVANLYNPVGRSFGKSDATAHDYASAVVEAWNAAASNAVKFAVAAPQVIDIDLSGSIVSKKAGSVAAIAVGLDRTDGIDGARTSTQGVDVLELANSAQLGVGVGAHSVTAVEVSTVDGGTYAKYAIGGKVQN